MKNIGLLSDTHGFLADEIIQFFRGVDEIWHAGDVGSTEVIDRLSAIAFVRGVYGNIDDYQMRAMLPEDNIFNIEEVKIYMTHIGGYPGKYEKRAYELIKREKPDLFISGHSHILKVMHDEKNNLLHMTPGAAGKLGLHKHVTALKFTVSGSRFTDLQVFEKERRRI
jgi:putative phosphoesterase